MAKSAAWKRKEGKNPEGGLNAKGRASYKRETGGTLKPPVSREQAKKSESAARANALRVGQSTHHLVAQPGTSSDHNSKRFTPKMQQERSKEVPPEWLGATTPEEAMAALRDSAARGIMACDWGCTQKVQSRGCAQHAQARWAPTQPGRQFRTT